MTDLTAITTPFGLLDRETQEALKAHGGPYQSWAPKHGWLFCPYEDGPPWDLDIVYRVKPTPPKPKEVWVVRDKSGFVCDVYDVRPLGVEFGSTCNLYREVIE